MNIRKQKNQPLKSYCEYVILDTDIGGDDAQALIYAIHEAKKTNRQIIGITCVNGNTYVQDVARNAVIVQALCNTEIPIYLGTFFLKKDVRAPQLVIWKRTFTSRKMALDKSKIIIGASIRNKEN